MIQNARKAMAEFGRAFPAEEQVEINGVLSQAEESMNTDDPTEIGLVLGEARRGRQSDHGRDDDTSLICILGTGMGFFLQIRNPRSQIPNSRRT